MIETPGRKLKIVRTVLFLLVLAISGEQNYLLQAREKQARGKPNLVFIIADDCTFRDVSCYGGQALTPNLDRLALEGMKFERCFQAAPMCSPTRHNIYTGIYPVKSGAYPNHTHANPGVKSIVHYLRPLGYRLMLSGKRHIGPRSVFPFEYTDGRIPDMEKIEGLFSEGIREKKPFCLFVCSNQPHTPWDKGDSSVYPPEKIKLPPYIVDTPKVREDFSHYLAEITYFDGQVGKVLQLLDQYKLAGNTLVMLVTEQGNAFPFAKWTCYGNGLQSAMIVRWPGHVKPGSVTNAMVEYVDVTPTLIDAAGGDPIPGLDGTSFVPVLEGKTDHHKDYVYGIMTTRGIHNGSDAYAIRTVRGEKYRLIRNLNYKTKFTNACTASDYFASMVKKAEAGDAVAKKLTHAYQHRPAVELYDVVADPLEMNNLASDPAYQDTISRLSGKLDEWMADQGDEGVATELRAYEHQSGNRKAKSRNKNGNGEERTPK